MGAIVGNWEGDCDGLRLGDADGARLGATDLLGRREGETDGVVVG